MTGREAGQRPPHLIVRVLLVVAALATIAGLFVVAAVAAPAQASTVRHHHPPRNHAATATGHPGWIIQNDELARLQAAGYSGTFGYVLCAGPETEHRTDLDPCQSWQVRDFSDESAFEVWAPSHPGDTALLDLESWSYTPPGEAANIAEYDCDAANLASEYGIRLIEAPVVPASQAPSVWKSAGKCGPLLALELQIQYGTAHPSQYQSLVQSGLNAVAGTGTPVIAGIGLDPGGYPVDPSTAYESWQDTHGLVAGYWLNLPIWPDGQGCAPAGCTPLAITFLGDVS